jgi:HSP20 family protein
MAHTDKFSEQKSQDLTTTQKGGVSRDVFSMSPREFFSASPFELMRRFTDEMDRVFSGLGRGGERAWTPAVEVRQKGDQLVVCAELPGMKKDDVKVEVTDEGLVIQGERKREEESREEGFYRSERSYGQFYRVIPLPEDAKVDQAKAQFNDGILEVSVPVPQQARPKRREIQIEGGGRSKVAGGGGA